MKKLLPLTLLTLLVFTLSISAQTPAQDSNAVLNGKALNLVRPAFPPAARAVRASGTVRVQVTIDENGNVISANAVSGHPLLRAAAENAARQSKFSPTTLSGSPVKVTGIIVYNFIADMNWLKIGYELNNAKNTNALTSQFPGSMIAGNLPAEWTAEKSELIKIDDYLFAREREDTPAPKATEAVGFVRGTRAVKYDIATLPPFVTNLQTKIENHLQADKLRLWYFKVGSVLGSLNNNVAESDLNALKTLVKKAPSEVSDSVTSNIEKILSYNKETKDTASLKLEITKSLIDSIKNSQIAK